MTADKNRNEKENKKENKRENKRDNTYVRMGLFMAVSAIVGGIVGVLTIMALDGNLENIESGAAVFLAQVQRIMLPLLIAITAVSVFLGERNIRKLREISGKLLESDDEEGDKWDYEEERVGARGMLTNILSQVLCVLVLSAGYSVTYITDGYHKNVLASCLVFLGCYAYLGFWQTRFVKTVKLAHPEKKGDPSSPKFHRQWLESCDEAEREIVYRSSYKAYIQMQNRWIPMLLLITMFGHLLFNTGIMAIVAVSFICLLLTSSYLRSCVSLKGAKL